MIYEYADALQIILKIGTSLSIISSLIDIFLYFIFPQNRSFNFTNIIILATINIIYSISTLLPFDMKLKQPENTTMCQIQSFLINFSHCAQYLQVSIMSYCLFIKLIARNHLENNSRIYRTIFFLLLISFPLVFSIYILLTKSYGSSIVFCWINIYTLYKKSHIKKVVLNFYIMIWFLLLMNLFFVVKIRIMISKNKIKNEIFQHLIKYPIILIIFSFPGAFNALYRLYQNNKDVDFMIFLQVISECSFVMVLNIYFILSPFVKQSIVNWIKNKNKDDIGNLMPIRDDSTFIIDDKK
jgi:hypothetical protein